MSAAILNLLLSTSAAEAGRVLTASQAPPAPTQSATATVSNAAATLTAAQSLPAPSQTATATVRTAASASQAMPAPSQTASGGPTAGLSAGQSLTLPQQTAAVSARLSLAAGQSVPAPAQAATAAVSDPGRTITVAHTIPAFQQVGAITAMAPLYIVASQAMPPPVSQASVHVRPFLLPPAPTAVFKRLRSMRARRR